MKLRQLGFEGYFEDQPTPAAQQLLIVEPQSELDEQLLAWSILGHGQTIEDDSARRDHVFYYELGDHLGGGIYSMQVSCRDASGSFHDVEVCAALAVSVGMGGQPAWASPAELGTRSFTPMWLISKSLHYVDHQEECQEDRDERAAFGHLRFDAASTLPHRRLFGATVH